MEGTGAVCMGEEKIRRKDLDERFLVKILCVGVTSGIFKALQMIVIYSQV